MYKQTLILLVSTETEAEYVKLIDVILRSSDLNTISEKRIRKGLQEAVNHDLTPQKVIARTLTLSSNSSSPSV